MRTGFRLALVVIVTAMLASGRVALAQPAPQVVANPAYSLLQSYLPARSELPAGLSAVSVSEQDNASLAVQLADPAVVQTIIDRARIDGAVEWLQRQNGSGASIRLSLDLYRDSGGAQAALQDLSDGVTPAPVLGDVSVVFQASSFSVTGALLDITGVAFSAGRLEVAASESGPSGSVSQADLLPLLTTVAQRAEALPPPPPSAAELAVLQSQTAPESILYDAYRTVFDRYPFALQAANLLSMAYTGALSLLNAQGLTNLPPTPSVTATDRDTAWAQFLPGYQQLESEAGPVSLSSLAHAAIAAIYDNLNCHTGFLSPSAYRNAFGEGSSALDLARQIVTGSHTSAGVSDLLRGTASGASGLIVSPTAPYIVLKVDSGSPADRAGVHAGDQIVAVDHATPGPQSGFTTAGTVIAPSAGVTLTLSRPGVGAPFDVTVVPGTYSAVIEDHRILPGNVGYIEFNQFIDTSSAAVSAIRRALSDFSANGNVVGWILDLRYNPGGSVVTNARVAGLFVPPGSLLRTEVLRDGTTVQTRSIGAPAPGQKPLVILTGPDTASSAEIFAQSLHDLGRATIIGSPTAGCVNGGQFAGLLDGSGVFISEYQLLSGPNEVALEGVGITPDVSAAQNPADLAAGIDDQLNAAVAFLTGSQP